MSTPTLTALDEAKAFENPRQEWKYSGTFSIELFNGSFDILLPKGATRTGDSILVNQGEIESIVAGVKFRTTVSDFLNLGHPLIRSIRKGGGGFLWVNHKNIGV